MRRTLEMESRRIIVTHNLGGINGLGKKVNHFETQSFGNSVKEADGRHGFIPFNLGEKSGGAATSFGQFFDS